MAIPYSIAKLWDQVLLPPEKTRGYPLDQVDSPVVAVSTTFTINIPRDRLIWAILISIGKDTTATGTQGTLGDFITSVQVIANGNKYFKDMDGDMAKQIMKVNLENPSTGFYKLYFQDPKSKDSKPLPAWIFTSLVLKIVDVAPGATNYDHIRVTLQESERIEDISGYRVLVEKYMGRSSFGTRTGYQMYEHERAYQILGYLYKEDDNLTLSDTKFDKLKVIGKRPDREDILLNELWLTHLKEQNTYEYMGALATGFHMVEFAGAFKTDQYTTLKSYLNIPTAGTDIGVKVLERYLL